MPSNNTDKQGLSFLDTLKIIFPPYVLALVFFPLVVGVFYNYQLVNTRQIAILLVWMSVFTIPFLLFRKKIFYYLVSILAFINGFVSLAFWLLIEHPITSSAMFILFNTNINEAADFTGSKSNWGYILFIPYLVIFIFALLRAPKIKFQAKKTTYYITIIIGIVTVLFIGENTIHGRLVRKGSPVLFKSVVSFNKEIKAFKKIAKKDKFKKFDIKATPTVSNKPEVVLLIMGESTNRNYMSLYGYKKNTNPLLSKFNGLILYNNVVSSYTFTLKSVLTALTSADLTNKKLPYQSISINDVFQSAGFKTYWLSNQSPFGAWDNMIALFARQFDETRFVNISASSSFEALYTHSYDQRLFLPLKQALAEKSKRKFIVLHLMGSHSEYNKRYPPNFDKFKGGATKKSIRKAHYDNAILYNDFVVDSVLKMVRNYCSKNDAIGSFVYVSDHGESVYDYKNKVGHGRIYTGKIPKCLVEIPFVVWLSPEYKKLFPNKTATIEANIHKPFVTDDLFYALIDVSRVKTPIFNPQKSVFNNQFNAQRKRILADGKDFDEK